jgi:O-antigen/teichoic acid export membrane protein
MQSVHRRIAAGAVWMVLLRLADRGIGFASTLILARLLVPADFGIVAMAASLMALVELLGAFGFDIALIREQNPTPQQFNCAWTLNISLGVVMATLMLALAWPLAGFYGEERLPLAIVALAAGTLAGSLENIGIVEFRRKLDFDREFRFQITKRLASFTVTLILALTIGNFWAMIAGMVTGRVTGALLSYVWHPFRPRFGFAGAQAMLNFSKWLLFNNIISFLRDRSSDFLIGRINGSAALGLYNMGYELANLPTTDLVAPISRAVFPGYAQIASDRPQLRNMFIAVISVTAMLAVPAGIGLTAVASLVTPLLLGDKWLEAIPVIEIVALHGVVHSLQSNVYATYLAVGRAELPAKIGMLYVGLLIGSMAIAAPRYGIVGAAYACLLTAVVVAPINLLICARLLGLPISRWAENVWRPLLAATAMYYVLSLLKDSLSGKSLWLTLGVCIAAGATVYVATLVILWILAGRPEGAERMVWSRIRPMQN